jgi:hypothetical protein
MDFKKMMPLFILLIMAGALVEIQTASAATSHIAIFNSKYEEVTSFSTTKDDDGLEIYARLYVDGEWRALRNLDFDVYGINGQQLIHISRLTSLIGGYAEMEIWSNYLYKWKPGDYTVIVHYYGNEDKGWPETSTSVVIHHN